MNEGELEQNGHGSDEMLLELDSLMLLEGGSFGRTVLGIVIVCDHCNLVCFPFLIYRLDVLLT